MDTTETVGVFKRAEDAEKATSEVRELGVADIETIETDQGHEVTVRSEVPSDVRDILNKYDADIIREFISTDGKEI